MTDAQRDIQRKLRVLDYAQQTKNVSKTCRYFGISRKTFHQWRKNLKERGEAGLINGKPCPQNVSLRTPPHNEEQILYRESAIVLDKSTFLGTYSVAMKSASLRPVLIAYSNTTA